MLHKLSPYHRSSNPLASNSYNLEKTKNSNLFEFCMFYYNFVLMADEQILFNVHLKDISGTFIVPTESIVYNYCYVLLLLSCPQFSCMVFLPLPRAMKARN